MYVYISLFSFKSFKPNNRFFQYIVYNMTNSKWLLKVAFDVVSYSLDN